MYIKNSVVTKEEEKELIEIIKNVCNKYGVRLIDELIINNQLRVVAGKYITSLYINKSTIKLSGYYYRDFGFDRIKKTLLHELSHHICFEKNYTFGHGKKFKEICYELGGSMNQQMAGEEYKKSATDEYRSEKKYRYMYICPGCGQVIKRCRKMSKKVLHNYECSNCNIKLINWKCKNI